MDPLSFLNYDTTYSFRIKDHTKNLEHQACFSYIFSIADISPKDCVHYTIWINRDPEYAQRSKSNYCFLSKQELHNHIRLVKKLFDFNFSIESKDDSFLVHIDISQPKIAHKYLLTWIRYIYEYPMNVMFYDVDRLKKEEKCFKFTSKANLFLLLSYFRWRGYRDIHCIPIGGYGKFLTNSQLSKAIFKTQSLNRIYEAKYNNRAYTIPTSWENYNYCEKEELDRTYQERLVHYLEFYNKVVK